MSTNGERSYTAVWLKLQYWLSYEILENLLGNVAGITCYYSPYIWLFATNKINILEKTGEQETTKIGHFSFVFTCPRKWVIFVQFFVKSKIKS